MQNNLAGKNDESFDKILKYIYDNGTHDSVDLFYKVDSAADAIKIDGVDCYRHKQQNRSHDVTFYFKGDHHHISDRLRKIFIIFEDYLKTFKTNPNDPNYYTTGIVPAESESNGLSTITIYRPTSYFSGVTSDLRGPAAQKFFDKVETGPTKSEATPRGNLIITLPMNTGEQIKMAAL
jgi:hypothetical protein